MARMCLFCKLWDKEHQDPVSKEATCTLLGYKTGPVRCCPGWKEARSEEQIAADEAERARLLALGNRNQPAKPAAKIPAKPKASKVIAQHETDYDQEIRLFDHQKNARNKFKDKNEIALFFEMGCGKTLTSMMIICDKFKAGVIDSLLVVAPNDVHKQWFDDLCDDESTLSKAIAQEGVNCIGQIIGGHGGQKEFYDFDDDDGKLHIVCTNIDTFSTPHKWEILVDWANKHKTAIIIDEATVIKNPKSKRAQRMLYEFNDVVKRGKTVIASTKKNPVRIILTGTPVTNGPMDLWAIMEFIKPNYFGRNYYSFMNYYGMHTQLSDNDRVVNVILTEKTWQGIHECRDYMEAFCVFGCSEDTYMTVKHQDHYMGPYKHADELKVLLEPNAVFAKLVDCVDMPAVNYITKEVSLSDAQRACYEAMKHDLLAQYKTDSGTVESTAKNKLVVSMRLQQIASGFIVAHKIEEPDEDLPMWADDDDSYDIKPDEVTWLGDSNPKLEQLMRDVDELDKPILILTRFSAEAAKIYDMLKDKYSTMLFTGWKTVGSMEDFKQGKYQIMVANISKVARGFNLQIVHTTIYYSNTYSMELRQQSEFRTFRMGQKHPCTYIDYVSCPVDKIIIESLRMKKNLLEYIRDKDMKEVI